MGAQEALTGMLTSPAELAALWKHPADVQLRYGLSDEELVMLLGAQPAGYALTAAGVCRKLRYVLERVLPATVAQLEADHASLWHDFLHTTVRQAQPGAALTSIPEAEQLLAWMAGRVPVAVVTFGRYELLRHRFGLDWEATQAARQWAASAEEVQARLTAHPDWVAHAMVVVAATVRTTTFDHDVTAGVAPRALPAGTTRILMHRVWGRWPPLCYRIAAGTEALLAYCDGTRRGAEAVAAAGGDVRAGAAALHRLAESGIVLCPRTDHEPGK